MQLQYGKRYVRADGKASSPLVASPDSNSKYCFFDLVSDCTYTPEGRYWGTPDYRDLVAPYIEPAPAGDGAQFPLQDGALLKAVQALHRRLSKIEAKVDKPLFIGADLGAKEGDKTVIGGMSHKMTAAEVEARAKAARDALDAHLMAVRERVTSRARAAYAGESAKFYMIDEAANIPAADWWRAVVDLYASGAAFARVKAPAPKGPRPDRFIVQRRQYKVNGAFQFQVKDTQNFKNGTTAYKHLVTFHSHDTNAAAAKKAADEYCAWLNAQCGPLERRKGDADRRKINDLSAPYLRRVSGQSIGRRKGDKNYGSLPVKH